MADRRPDDPAAPTDPADPARDPMRDPAPDHAAAPPSGSTHAAVEAPGRRGASTLMIVGGVVLLGLVGFWLFAGVADEAVEPVVIEGAAPEAAPTD